MNVEHTVGPEKVSMTVIRKTVDDLVVAQFSSERWFATDSEATAALTRVLRVFTDGGGDEKEVLLRVKLPEVTA